MCSFDGLSVLLLEDEYLIAMDTEQTLTSFGVGKVNVVNTLEEAAKAAEDDSIHLAILDININGKSSFEVAERLRQKGTPIVFASGYGSRKRHAAVAEDAIYLNKPYTKEALRESMVAALRKAGRSQAA
jgi:DNA-binding response OmpR family regulator